jgi:methyl-accepting chemotaxis protein
MNIRAKLTFRFTVIVAAIILLLSSAIYYFSADYRKSEFYGRLKDRGYNTAKLLIDVDEVNSNLLSIIERNSAYSLMQEDVVILNATSNIIYCNCSDSTPIRYIKDKISRIWLDRELHFNDKQREAVGFIFQGKNERYIVVVAAFDQFGLSKLKYLRLILVLGSFFSTSLVFIAGWIFAGQALKPVALITSEADKITGSDLQVRLHEGNKKDELARLAMTFNRMLNRLEKSFEIQRSFVSNSSHELRNSAYCHAWTNRSFPSKGPLGRRIQGNSCFCFGRHFQLNCTAE